MNLRTAKVNKADFEQYFHNVHTKDVKEHNLKKYEDELSTKLTPKQINRIKTLTRAFYKDSTSKEIEKAHVSFESTLSYYAMCSFISSI